MREPTSRKILLATLAAHLLSAFVTGLNGPLAPYLQADLGLSRAQIGSLTTFRFVATVAVALPAGFVIGRIGVRRSLMLTLAGMVLGASLFALVRGPIQAYIVFFILGMAFAMVNPATTKAIMDYFPMRGRATMMAFKQTGVPLGGVMASVLFPLIASYFGWRISVSAAAGLTLLALAWIYRTLQPALMPHDDEVPAKGPAPAAGNRPTVAAFTSLFRERDLVLTSILQGAYMMAQVNVSAYMVLFLNEELGFHVVLAGAIAAAAQVSGTVARLFWGMAADYWLGGRVNTLRVIGFTMAAGLLATGFLSRTTPPLLVWLVALGVGIGSLGWAGTVTLLRAELVGRERAALATGFGMTIGSWGALAGPPFFGLLVDMTGVYKFAWWTTAAVSLLATLALQQVREPAMEKSRDRSVQA